MKLHIVLEARRCSMAWLTKLIQWNSGVEAIAIIMMIAMELTAASYFIQLKSHFSYCFKDKPCLLIDS